MHERISVKEPWRLQESSLEIVSDALVLLCSPRATHWPLMGLIRPAKV